MDRIEALAPSVRAMIATHILFPADISISWPMRVVGEMLLFLANVWIRRQRPQLREHHAARHDNVRALYDSESRRYLHTHARTTCRDDDAWRLWLGQALVTQIRQVNAQHRRPAPHLDLFAGSGLSYLSQAKMFHLYDVAVNTILLDASPGMLDVAAKLTIPNLEREGYATFIAPELPEPDKQAMRRDSRRTVEVLQADPDGNGSAPMGAEPGRPRALPTDSLTWPASCSGLGRYRCRKPCRSPSRSC
jgi:hypothetical protein